MRIGPPRSFWSARRRRIAIRRLLRERDAPLGGAGGRRVCGGRPSEVFRVSAEAACRDPAALEEAFRAFAASVEQRRYRPRDWILAQATPELARGGGAQARSDNGSPLRG